MCHWLLPLYQFTSIFFDGARLHTLSAFTYEIRHSAFFGFSATRFVLHTILTFLVGFNRATTESGSGFLNRLGFVWLWPGLVYRGRYGLTMMYCPNWVHGSIRLLSGYVFAKSGITV